jgi:drug/metabolite transporter (DMT)-like permease
MNTRQAAPPRTHGYSLASLLLLMAFLATGMALLRSGLSNGVASDDMTWLVGLIVCGQVIGAAIGFVIGMLGPRRRVWAPISAFAGAIAGGFCGAVFAINIWFPLFPLGAIVVCVVAAIISGTRRSTLPPPPPSAAIGESPFASPPER